MRESILSDICRKVLAPDGQSTRIEDKVLTINIKPGWKSGTKITFPKEGDQHPGRVPADIVFVIKDKHHPKFKVILDLVFQNSLKS